jgi:tRNA synthetases class II (D, K and N)/OB-fold nucleic acid binding domain
VRGGATVATRIHTDELAEHVGRRVLVRGWLHRFRQLGRVSFALVRDGEGMAQAVIRTAEPSAILRGLHLESAIEILGEVVANPHAPGGHELVDASVRIVAGATQPPPFDLFRPEISAQLPTILDHAAVSLRHTRSREALRIAARSVEAFRSGLSDRGVVEIFTPKIVATCTESGASVFPVEYFGRKAYLAQSPQLYKQMMVGVFERVFEVGPVFRAETHDTTRHLTEYVSLDAEMGFIDDERDVVQVLRDVIEDMVAAVGEDERAIRIAGATLPRVPDSFPVLHFSDAQASIGEATGEDLVGPGRPCSRPRTVARRVGRSRTGIGVLGRHRLSHAEAALLHASGSRSPGLLPRVRPALPRGGDRDRRPAAAPSRGLRAFLVGTRRAGRRARGVHGRLQARDSASRRVRHRFGALGCSAGSSTECSRRHGVSSRHVSVDSVIARSDNRARGLGAALSGIERRDRPASSDDVGSRSSRPTPGLRRRSSLGRPAGEKSRSRRGALAIRVGLCSVAA